MGEVSGLVEPDPYAGARNLSVAVVGDTLLGVTEAPLAHRLEVSGPLLLDQGCDMGYTIETDKTCPALRLLPLACSSMWTLVILLERPSVYQECLQGLGGKGQGHGGPGGVVLSPSGGWERLRPKWLYAVGQVMAVHPVSKTGLQL